MRHKGSSIGPTLTGSLVSLTAQDTPSKEAKNPKGHNDKGGRSSRNKPPTEEEGSTPPPIAASGWTHAPEAAKDRGPLEANPDNKQARPTGGTHAQKLKGPFEVTGREDERSGGGPPPDATKREGGTGIPSDDGSVEGLSMSESSLSSEDTTPAKLGRWWKTLVALESQEGHVQGKSVNGTRRRVRQWPMTGRSRQGTLGQQYAKP